MGRTDRSAGRATGRCAVCGRGARQERHGRGRASGDTAMLACDTTEGPAATRPRLLLHGASASSARDHARPGRRMGMLAGSTGLSWYTVHLAQF